MVVKVDRALLALWFANPGTPTVQTDEDAVVDALGAATHHAARQGLSDGDDGQLSPFADSASAAVGGPGARRRPC